MCTEVHTPCASRFSSRPPSHATAPRFTDLRLRSHSGMRIAIHREHERSHTGGQSEPKRQTALRMLPPLSEQADTWAKSQLDTERITTIGCS